MNDDGPGDVRSNDSENPAKMHMWFQRFLRLDSAWVWRGWVLFWCASVFCTAQAVPRLIHPDFRWGWDPSFCYWIIGVSGAATGLLVAQYRFAGLLAGAIAGISSLLTGIFVLEAVDQFSRIFAVMATGIGMLPGVAVYCGLHFVIAWWASLFQKPQS
jgi:hypothetical protein